MTVETAVLDQDIVPLDDIAQDVVGLRVLFVNLFGIRTADGWVLVDAGLRGSASRIRSWARQHFGDRPPRAVVLTHGHFDHVGALPALLEHWDVPVYAHRLEMPYVQGRRSYPPPNPHVGGGLMARMSALYPRGPIELGRRVRALEPRGTIAELPGWQWLHTPGHTDGHVSLFRAADRTLIVGDAFCTAQAESLTASLTQTPELHGPPAYFTTDWVAARESVVELAELDPAVVASGHGRPMAGSTMRHALRVLADEFDTLGHPPRRASNGTWPVRAISPAQHAVLDYAVTATFLAAAWKFSGTQPRAAQLALVNAGMVLGLSLLTDYPGGVYRTLSFKGHRRGDLLQLATAALGPSLLGFAGSSAAAFFYGQALGGAAVIATTDWDAPVDRDADQRESWRPA